MAFHFAPGLLGNSCLLLGVPAVRRSLWLQLRLQCNLLVLLRLGLAVCLSNASHASLLVHLQLRSALGGHAHFGMCSGEASCHGVSKADAMQWHFKRGRDGVWCSAGLDYLCTSACVLASAQVCFDKVVFASGLFRLTGVQSAV